MANIALRNPQFKFHAVPSSGVLSTQADITIGGVLRYVIVKNNPDTLTGFNVDISELTRDYLDITYSATNAIDSIAVTTLIRNFVLINGSSNTASGQAVVGSPSTYSDVGFEAYGTYEELVNPVLPFGRAQPTWLLASETQGTSATDTFTIYFPENTAGRLSKIVSNSVSVVSFGNTATTINNGGGLPIVTIKRISCTKYGTGTRVIFVNKYGVQQDLWFFLKKVETLSKSNERYKRNTLETPDDEHAQYNISTAPTALFNTQGKKEITLNSGYYPETAVPYFEQLLYSEYVWIDLPRPESGAFTAVPFIVKNSTIKRKTSVNDRLIEYTIDFEMAADDINNIR